MPLPPVPAPLVAPPEPWAARVSSPCRLDWPQPSATIAATTRTKLSHCVQGAILDITAKQPSCHVFLAHIGTPALRLARLLRRRAGSALFTQHDRLDQGAVR